MPGKRPPFRADHVGSLLRPRALLAAREEAARGAISKAELRKAEDEAILEAVAIQEGVGLKGITDGEFRRTYFHTDFLEQIEGVTIEEGSAKAHFHKAGGEELDFAPPKLRVTGKLNHARPIMADDFRYVASVTKQTPKITIPSPSMAHFRGGRGAIDASAYPDIQDFFDDLSAVYRNELKSLSDAGCRYLQLDDTNLAYLCDDHMREGAKAMGEDPDELPHTYAKLINASLRDRPADMTTAIHLCRGNFRSAWVAEGGYDPVAEALFGEIDVDAFFLEYDDERSGTFGPLRYVPKGKYVVLGLISSKRPELESKDELKRRIDSAAKVVDLDQLCISPQCGFSSTVHGNDVSFDDQRRKLELLVETAQDVWGEI